MRIACSVIATLVVASGGCGVGGLQTKEIYGTVSVDGQRADSGWVRFVPIDGTDGPSSSATIVDGEYRIQARGGVPLGKHRVEVVARRKTGRKVEGRGPISEVTMVDEMVPMGPENYASAESPLVIEVLKDSDSQINLELPAR